MTHAWFRPAGLVGAALVLAAGAAAVIAPVPVRADDAAVALPPAKPGETVADVLMPGGKPVGLASRQMRELPGGEQGANALFTRLTAGAADVTPPNFPGVVRKRADGVTVTYLLPVKGGTPPTIIVAAAKLPISELQFPPNPGRDGGGM